MTACTTALERQGCTSLSLSLTLNLILQAAWALTVWGELAAEQPEWLHTSPGPGAVLAKRLALLSTRRVLSLGCFGPGLARGHFALSCRSFNETSCSASHAVSCTSKETRASKTCLRDSHELSESMKTSQRGQCLTWKWLRGYTSQASPAAWTAKGVLPAHFPGLRLRLTQRHFLKLESHTHSLSCPETC